MTNIQSRTISAIDEINQLIEDRSDCFYWQTDRVIDPAIAGDIFAKRHELVSDAELKEQLQKDIGKKVTVVSRKESDQTNLGNVNAVRTIKVENKEYIVRSHPKGLVNGYFWVEKVAADLARSHNLNAYKTLKVTDNDGEHSFSYMVIQKLPGRALSKYIEANPKKDDELATVAGREMARLHAIKVDGYGFFDNRLAKSGKLKGIHDNFKKHVLAGLDFNLDILQSLKFIDKTEVRKIHKHLNGSKIPNIENSALIHNDFADWNLLTDGQQITGVLDWDECFAGDPIADLGCWTTFYDMKRLKPFLKGYKEAYELPKDFEERLWFYRLRYLVSKLTLRARRLSWDFSDHRQVIEKKLSTGRSDLLEAMKRLGI